MPKLTDSEAETRLSQLDGWALRNGEISKTYRLPSFRAAIAFVTQVGLLAEAAAHHPDIDIRYTQVTLALTTHDAGGLSEKDFDLAALVDTL